MKQLLTALALAGLAAACGDDSGSTTPVVHYDGGVDAGPKDAGPSSMDSGPGATVKVTNPGAACTTAAQCMGPGATCDTQTSTKVPYPGGYCSASCLKVEECGPLGDCPVGEIIGQVGAATAMATTGDCYAKCTPGAASGCRTGYVCTTLSAALGVAAALPALSRNLCLPVPPAGADAGAGDAGTVARVDGGLDAGH